jgi:hypothetical protein
MRCVLIVIFLICSVSVVQSTNNWTISGNTVYIDTPKAYISASPHTIMNSQYVYFNITPKTYTGFRTRINGINFCFSCNSNDQEKEKISRTRLRPIKSLIPI